MIHEELIEEDFEAIGTLDKFLDAYFAMKEIEPLTIDELQETSFDIAEEHGFWDDAPEVPDKYIVASKLALIHSEVSEALEDVRETEDSNELSVWHENEAGKPVGFPSEIADIIIRAADLAQWLGIDLTAIIRAKQEYNDTRPVMHGKTL